MLDSLIRFFSGWRFAVMAISIMAFFALLMLSSLFIPESAGAAAAFADDFKVWCFGYDPATGQMEWGYVWKLLILPVLFSGIIVLIWWEPLKEARSSPAARVAPYVAGSFLLACVLGAGLVSLGDFEGETASSISFPAERLRTSHTSVPFSLVNQEEKDIDLAGLDGRVVMITGVYASCGYTCPLILAQTKRVLAALPEEERSQLSVIAITLDPEHDTPEILASLVSAQKLDAPLFNAVTGDPDYVNEVLDRYGFSRSRNPETGIIDHSNLFILIDRSGKIAFRFSIGEIQEAWLEDALHLLISENSVEI